MSLLVYFSILGAIISDVTYHFSQRNIPRDTNPIFIMVITYLIATIVSLITSFIFNKEKNITKQFLKPVYGIIFLSISIIVIELSILLAYRMGGEISKLYNIFTPLQSIVFVLIGVVIYREKLNLKSIIGTIFAVLGITLLSLF